MHLILVHTKIQLQFNSFAASHHSTLSPTYVTRVAPDSNFSKSGKRETSLARFTKG